jgi:aspartate/methionine/tyrosine aminotransferase
VQSGVNVKGIVVINPGNPTGAVLDEGSIRAVIQFAREHNLVIIADEVYQENVYGGKFISFAKVLGREDVPLFSMLSISKGFYGECGHRGGYLEVRNPPKVQGSDLDFIDLLTKQASVSLCSNTAGQVLTYLDGIPTQAWHRILRAVRTRKREGAKRLRGESEHDQGCFHPDGRRGMFR